MQKTFFRACSLLLVLVMLVNLLPMHSFAEEFLASQETELTTEPAPTGQIAEELVDKRTAYTKQFRLDNGLYMAAVYPEPVHFRQDGQWQEIDNTLTARLDGTYANTAGVWDVRFPSQLTGSSPITVTKDGYTLSFAMAGELRTGGELALASLTSETLALTPAQTSSAQLQTADVQAMKEAAQHEATVTEKLTAGLLYENVYGATDIRYDLNSNKLKESVILDSYSSTLRGYRYTLEVGSLVPVLAEDGRIDFYDAAQENIVMSMPAPFLVDDAMAYSYDVQVQLTGTGSTYTLTYLLPQQWLAADDRAWPVVLDPVITADLDINNIRDITVAENKTFSHNWGMNSCGYSTEIGIHRFYLKYLELPELTSADVVVSAAVQLYKPYDSSVTIPVQVHKVLDTWESETMTWANQPDFDPTVEDYDICEDTDLYTWDVTDIARGWYEGENTGMVFRVSDANEASTTSNFKEFISSDFTENTSYMPTLVINFRNNNGLESYWDYTASSAGRAGTGYVNNYTGNLVWVRSDIGFGGNRMPVSISHVYNANDALTVSDSNNANDTSGNAFGMGYGWRTNFNQLVYQWKTGDSTSSDYYVWEDSDGTDHYFKYESSGTYKDEDGLELTLKTTGSGTTKYSITDKYGNVSYFDTYGRLTQQVNNQAIKSSITVTYTTTSGKLISTVTDGAGRKYAFTYSGNLLSRISYKGTGSTELSYVAFGYTNSNLTTVTDKDGEVCTYKYANNHLIYKALDVDGYNIHYIYSTTDAGKPNRVTKIREYNDPNSSVMGGELTFTYEHNQTTLTDWSGNVQIMQFNNLGNTVCIQDGQGRAQYAQYAKNEASDAGKGNQLTLSSKLQNTVGNVLPYSSFETGGAWYSNSSSLTVSRSTEQAYQGNYSLKLVSTTTNYVAALWSSYAVAPGETFTFSAYVKSTDASGFIALHYGGDYTTYSGPGFSAGQGWTRLEKSYTNTTSETRKIACCLFTKTAGTVYMDCVQFEKSPTASRFNLVENGDFTTGTGSWTVNSYTRTTASAAVPQLNSSVLAITGSPEGGRRATQTVKVSGVKDDTFVLAGWAKGNSVPLEAYDDRDREFALQAVFNYTDGTTSEAFTARFNPDSTSWQYSAAPMVAKQAYSSITVRLVYDYNMNTVYFDGIQLFKEEFGTSYTYDDKGNVSKVVDLQKQTTTYKYENNDLTQILQGNKAKMTYAYDSYHNVKTATSQEGLVYSFTYDDYGNNTVVSIGSGSTQITSRATYSSDGNRLESTTDALGNTTTYGYNANTNVLEWVQYPEDTAATRTNYTYDSMYRLASAAVTTDTDLSLSASYTYDNDLLTKIETGSTTYSFSYGNFALRSSIQVGSRTLAKYTYTKGGTNRLETLDYGNKDSVNYTYDQQGRVTKQTYEDGDTVTYQYDNSGALATVSDSATGRKTTYYYDFTDRLMKYVESGTGYSHSVGYAYDTLNNLTSLVETINGVEHTTSYAYDDDNRVSSVTTDGITVEYKYDAYGRVIEQKTKNGSTQIMTETFTYVNPSSATTSSQIATHKTETANYSITYTYTYDKNGNILSVSDGTNTTSYVYDSANQLIRENHQRRNETYVWTYDDAGNILSRETYTYTTGDLDAATAASTASTAATYSRTAAEEMTPLGEEPTQQSNHMSTEQMGTSAMATATATTTNTYTYGDTDWGDLLTAYNGAEITYDGIGNPLSDGTRTFTWEHGRQMASMTKNNSTWTYTYNSDGLRTSRTNGVTTYDYVYSGDLLKQMTVTDVASGAKQVLTFTYDATGTPLTLDLDGTVYYYLTNIQGDVTGIVDSTGNLLIQYVYEGYGKSYFINDTSDLTVTLGSTNPLAYRAYVFDMGTALYYLQSRYYDQFLGRFLNADRAISGMGEDLLGNNMFAYCFNNPVNMGDSTGDWPKWLENTVKVVSVVVAVVAVVATVAAVSAFTAGTGTAVAVYGASVLLGASLAGINSAVANESKGNSYANGYAGGLVGGAVQAAASVLPAGNIWGGALGAAKGTETTMSLNNLDPDSENASKKEIVTSMAVSAGKAAVTGSLTQYFSSAVGGINLDTGILEGAVANQCNGLLPSLTLGFGEAIKGFFGWLDDALVYIWE